MKIKLKDQEAKKETSNKNFVLIETIEREISTPAYFETYRQAYEEMMSRFNSVVGCNDDDDDDYETGHDECSAYAQNLNHDNCDWKIFRV